MVSVFLSVLNMSLTASFVIAAILAARLPLKKAPKAISYALWAVAGFRLVFPFSITSVFSLLPFNAAPIPPNIVTQAVPRIESGIALIDDTLSAALPAAVPVASANPLQVWFFAASCVWLAGIALMLIYSFVSIALLKRRLRGAVQAGPGLYEADNLKTPFVIGLFNPRVYIPAGLSAEERRYIMLHEQTHIRRHDPAVKMLAYLILCLHWFNPLAWAAFILMGADMEMSCDERVMREMGGEVKNAYSLTLVRVAAGRRIPGGSPLAFGEGGMKERVKNVLRFKKHSRLIIIIAVALVAALSVGFAVNRVNEALPWAGVPQKDDWPVRDMTFDRITFGSDRELIEYRMGREPDAEDVLADETIIYYHDPGMWYTPPEGGEAALVPGSAYDVTFYLDNRDCINKKNLHRVYRIDIAGGIPAIFEMTGREMIREGVAGTLTGVLDQYGGPNAVERDGDTYTLWYYRPDDTDKRLWFEVKDGELTGRMGIVCLCEGEGIGAAEAAEQLADSITRKDGEIIFRIPPRYYKPQDWNISVTGHDAKGEAFSVSVNLFNDMRGNHTSEDYGWATGEWYAVPTEGRGLTALTMDVYLTDDRGNLFGRNIDLLEAAPVVFS